MNADLPPETEAQAGRWRLPVYLYLIPSLIVLIGNIKYIQEYDFDAVMRSDDAGNFWCASLLLLLFSFKGISVSLQAGIPAMCRYLVIAVHVAAIGICLTPILIFIMLASVLPDG